MQIVNSEGTQGVQASGGRRAELDSQGQGQARGLKQEWSPSVQACVRVCEFMVSDWLPETKERVSTGRCKNVISEFQTMKEASHSTVLIQ